MSYLEWKTPHSKSEPTQKRSEAEGQGKIVPQPSAPENRLEMERKGWRHGKGLCPRGIHGTMARRFVWLEMAFVGLNKSRQT